MIDFSIFYRTRALSGIDLRLRKTTGSKFKCTHNPEHVGLEPIIIVHV